jgi:hypothetical protein
MILPIWLCSFDNSDMVLSESRSGKTNEPICHALIGSRTLNSYGRYTSKSEDCRFVSTSRTPLKDGYRHYEHLVGEYEYYDDDDDEVIN